MNIPYELFSVFLGISVGLGIFGFVRQPQIPAMLVFGGMFILVMSVMTDNVIMGSIPVSSTTSGSTTTYVMEDNLFEFTALVKTLFALLGVIMMLSGAIMVSKV